MIKYKFYFLVLSALLICVFGCTATDSDMSVKSNTNNETRVYEVFGMSCPGCHGGLEKLVKKIPAVQEAEANWQKKQLVVIVHPEVELNDEDIYDAIRRANFTLGKRIK
ncbi:MAG: heavy-metal-associated domain-containing protein [Planctomycetota bacterium]|jgi:copper chaperone CopZ